MCLQRNASQIASMLNVWNESATPEKNSSQWECRTRSEGNKQSLLSCRLQQQQPPGQARLHTAGFPLRRNSCFQTHLRMLVGQFCTAFLQRFSQQAYQPLFLFELCSAEPSWLVESWPWSIKKGRFFTVWKHSQPISSLIPFSHRCVNTFGADKWENRKQIQSRFLPPLSRLMMPKTLIVGGAGGQSRRAGAQSSSIPCWGCNTYWSAPSQSCNCSSKTQ